MAYNPNNSNGQKTMANSAPVVIASDQSNVPINNAQLAGTTVDVNSGSKSAGTQRMVLATDQPALTTAGLFSAKIDQTTPGTTNGVTITDGTNATNVLKNDGTAAGQNAQLIAGSYLSVPFTTTTVQAVASTDVGDYNYVSVHQTTAGGSSVTNFQGSNDNTNWVTIALAQPNNLLSSPSLTGGASSIYSGPLQYRYFRLNITGIASGTTAGTVVFFTNRPTSLTTVAGQITLNGTSAMNVSQFNGTTAVNGSGTATGALRVELPTNGTGVIATVTNLATIGTSVTPGTAAANLGKAEDASHTSGDTGVFALAVRNDNAATTPANANTDYSQISVDAAGRVITALKVATGTITSVASSATNVTILAANSARQGAVISNDSTAILYIKFAATATTSSYTYKMQPDAVVEVPYGYTGIIDGIWASANGNARVTELA